MRAAVLIACLLAAAVSAAAAPPGPGSLPWAQAPEDTRAILDRQLESPHWTFRAFALQRLERYHGPDVSERVRRAVADDAWQVRCFALRAAGRLRVDLDAEVMAEETEPHVIRAAVAWGAEIPTDRLRAGTQGLWRSAAIDDVILGLEIAAVSRNEGLRSEARRIIAQVLRELDDATAARLRDALARVLGANPAPDDARAWRAWAAARGRAFDLAPAPVVPSARTAPRPLVADWDDDVYGRFVNYLDGLRSTDLEVAIVMDATSSMVPMINEARGGVDRLIGFLSDLARTMRLAFIVYRDHDNEPIWEGERFTTDIEAVRRFLWGIRITGGRDLPEAVFEGLQACGRLSWSADADKRVMLVGDARPHDDDEYRIARLVEAMHDGGVMVHAIHVPMRLDPDWERRVSAPARDAYAAEVREHNVRTEAAFDAIARLGGGQRVTLASARELVPSLMRFSIDEAWWPAFEQFYGAYERLCR